MADISATEISPNSAANNNIENLTRLADYKPFGWRITSASLTFALDPTNTIVTADLTFQRLSGGPKDLFLHGEELSLLSLEVNKKPLEESAYRLDKKGLTLLSPPDAFSFKSTVAINPSANTQLSGLYVSAGRFCTQCEAEGFRRITFWPDRPDVMAKYHVRLDADKALYPTLLCNGNPVAAGDYEDGRHFAEWSDPFAKPSYLFALVGGKYDMISDEYMRENGRKVSLNIFVDEGQKSKAYYAMDALKRAFEWDETCWGLVYDLDVFNVVAVGDFNFGAMENKGLNIFNSALLLAEPDTATDADYALIEAVIGHEYFHNWSGNRVTCRDWFQLSLKEGLTVFRDQEFSADQRSAAVKRIEDVKRLRARQFGEDAGPLAHPVRPKQYVKIDNFYTATIYEKGAEIIRVAQNLMGAEKFAQGAANYFDLYDGTAATIDNWVSALRTASKKDGGADSLAAIEGWYDQAGTPELEIKTHYDMVAREFKVQFAQSWPDTPDQKGVDKVPVPIPVKLGFLGQNGKPLTLTMWASGQNASFSEAVVRIDQAAQELLFLDVTEKPVLSALRGFSAPVRLKMDQSLSDIALLATYDADGFNRWEAGQNLARIALGAAGAKSQSTDAAEALRSALAISLSQADSDPAFAALMLTLPEAGELMQLRPGLDPALWLEKRAGLRLPIARGLNNHIEARIFVHDLDGAFTPDAASAGKRALFAALTDWYAAGADEANKKERASTLAELYSRGKNMNDVMALLRPISALDEDVLAQVLTPFERKWAQNPLVMDKFFALQSGSSLGDPLARFKALLGHKAFTLKNPNRVRSVAFPFAQRAVGAFHSADGAGYDALAALILDVDKVNPALAAGLGKLFETIALCPDPQKITGGKVLTDILGQELSANLREILAKIREPLP